MSLIGQITNCLFFALTLMNNFWIQNKLKPVIYTLIISICYYLCPFKTVLALTDLKTKGNVMIQHENT